MDEHVADPPDAEIRNLRKGEFKKRTCCHDMQIRNLFIEVPERGNRPWANLDFIKEEERLSGNDALPGNRLDLRADSPDVVGTVKNRG